MQGTGHWVMSWEDAQSQHRVGGVVRVQQQWVGSHGGRQAGRQTKGLASIAGYLAAGARERSTGRPKAQACPEVCPGPGEISTLCPLSTTASWPGCRSSPKLMLLTPTTDVGLGRWGILLHQGQGPTATFMLHRQGIRASWGRDIFDS